MPHNVPGGSDVVISHTPATQVQFVAIHHVTTVSTTELANPVDVKLLNRSDPFFVDRSNSS